MLKITRWSPDTCKCVLEYEWDTDVPEAQRVHSIKNVVSACPAHAAHATDKPKHFNVVVEENQRKNRALQKVAETASQFAEIVDGQVTPDLNKLSWSFDVDRNVIIDTPGISAKNKSDLKQILDAAHGTDKVKING